MAENFEDLSPSIPQITSSSAAQINNLAPEASQVHQLTTFEVLTALNSVNDSRGGENSAVEHLTVPDRDRLWIRLKDGIHSASLSVGSFVYRNVPHGLNSNRLGIQWTCIGFVVMIFEFISPPKHPFWNACWLPFANYIAINALTTIEMATGATNRNAVLRILGTTLAALLSFAVLVPMVLVGWEGQDDSYMVRWIMYYACTPAPFIWNFFIYHYPTYMHENFTFQGLSTQVYLFGSNSKKIVWDMGICTIGCYIGTVVGFVGYQLIVPLRARDKLTHDISLISYKLSYSLEPLIEFESGAGSQKPRKTISKSPLLAKSLSKVRKWRARGSKTDLVSQGSKIIKRFSVRFKGGGGGSAAAPFIPNSPFAPSSVNAGGSQPEDMDKFKNHVWDCLEDCNKLMENHEEVLAHAKREHYWTKPHFFHYRHFKRVSSDCMALYYHVTSLFLLLQAQLVTTPQITLPKIKPLGTATNLTGAGDADFGGLFLGSSRLIGSEKSSSSNIIELTKINSPILPPSPNNSISPIELSVPCLDVTADDQETGVAPATAPIIGPMAKEGVAADVQDHSARNYSREVEPEMTTTADVLNPDKMYSPLEAVIASKAPQFEASQPEMAAEAQPAYQTTLPVLPEKKTSDLVIKHAATTALTQKELEPQRASSVDEALLPKTSPSVRGFENTIPNPAIITAESRRANFEMRQSLREAALEEKIDVMETLASVKNIMTVGDGTLTVPQNNADPQRQAPLSTNLVPPPGGPSSPGDLRRRSSSVHVGGELDILVSAPADFTEEAPIAPAKVIGLAPVVKWAEVFGPLFGEIAGHMGHVLELIGECLDICQWNTAIWEVLEEAESSLARLRTGRKNWWQVSQEMASLISSNLHKKDCVADQGMYDELEEKFCLPWLGLTLDAYGRLPAAVKDDLWVSFENMQDRQTMAVKTCAALTARLRCFAHSCQAYLTVQFPPSTTGSKG